MNKIAIALGVLIIVMLGAWYFYAYVPTVQAPEKTATDVDDAGPLNATYSIDGQAITLVDGLSEVPTVAGSAAKITTQYFGNEVTTDLDGDGRADKVFLLTQTTGGTGTFYYVVAALNTEAGWVGSQAILLGDRIAPQTTEVSQDPNHENVIIVNYMVRAAGQAMIEQPTVGRSSWLKLDVPTLSWGMVEQGFSGEANPDDMSLFMKDWVWQRTTYNNDTQLVPKEAGVFKLTINDSGIFNISTDCNYMSGEFDLHMNEISFRDMTSTMMYCEDSQEQEFAGMLSEVRSFFFTNKGELVLELKLDSGSAIFR